MQVARCCLVRGLLCLLRLFENIAFCLLVRGLQCLLRGLEQIAVF